MSFIDELIEKIIGKQRKDKILRIEGAKENEIQNIEETIEPKNIEVK